MTAWQGLLQELVRDRRPALIGYATLLTGDRVRAEDLVHDAIVRTFARPRSFPSLDAADACVRREIASAFIDRKRARRRRLGAAGRVVGDDVAQGDGAAGRLDVRAALGGLPGRQRACVVMRFYDDMRAADIADALGLSEGAVERDLRDGVHRLNAALGTTSDLEASHAPTAEVLVSGREAVR